MAMCNLCKLVRRKAKGESWSKMMCKGCYRLTGHYTYDARWDIADYLTPADYSIGLNRALIHN